MQVQFPAKLASKLSSWTAEDCDGANGSARLSWKVKPQGRDCSCCGGHDAPPSQPNKPRGEANSWVDMIHGEMALHLCTCCVCDPWWISCGLRLVLGLKRWAETARKGGAVPIGLLWPVSGDETEMDTEDLRTRKVLTSFQTEYKQNWTITASKAFNKLDSRCEVRPCVTKGQLALHLSESFRDAYNG